MDIRFALPADTVLDGSYRIERVVGSGGFGITYEAEDVNLGTAVAIKEYYPFDFGDRDATMSVKPKSDRHQQTFNWGRANFLQEARTLARFEHPSIVRVTRVFEANSTAYMVMRFEQGQSFEDWLRGLGRLPTQEELDSIVAPLLDALQMMHAENFLHRDIAPDNIMVRADGTPVLLDFGAARRAVGEMSRSMTGIVKAGYSPHEQYSSDSRLQGPWSDLYALGGTLYRAVTGSPRGSHAAGGRGPHAARIAGRKRVSPGLPVGDRRLPQGPPFRKPAVRGQLRPMVVGSAPQPKDEVEGSPQARATPSQPMTRRIASASAPFRAPSSRWLAIAAVLAVVAGGAYGVSQYTGLQSAEPGMRDAEAKRLSALIEVRRKEAADAAQRQVELEAEQQRKDAAAAAQRQAEIEAERRRKEAADAAQRRAEIEAACSARRLPMPPNGKSSSTKRGGERKRWNESLLLMRKPVRPQPRQRPSAWMRSAAGLLCATRPNPTMTRRVSGPRLP